MHTHNELALPQSGRRNSGARRDETRAEPESTGGSAGGSARVVIGARRSTDRLHHQHESCRLGLEHVLTSPGTRLFRAHPRSLYVCGKPPRTDCTPEGPPAQ